MMMMLPASLCLVVLAIVLQAFAKGTLIIKATAYSDLVVLDNAYKFSYSISN